MQENNGPFKASDLPIMDGRIYHLDITPEEMSPDIIIVGDPDRPTGIAEEQFARDAENRLDIEVEKFHRGLRVITGKVKGTGHRISLITSGMGTPSLEIVVKEIISLDEIDFDTRTRNSEYPTINIVRLGTSGGYQKDTKLGTAIITDVAIGTDNTGLFYRDNHKTPREERIREKVRQAIHDAAVDEDGRRIEPYVASANPELYAALVACAEEAGIRYKTGMTVSSSGFFGPQGRDISRAALSVPNIDGVLADLNFEGEKSVIENNEMESSFLFRIMRIHGYRAAAICPAIANRREDTFDVNYQDGVKNATQVAVNALYMMRHNPPA